MHPIITTYYGVTFNNTHLYYGVLAAMLAVHRSAVQCSAVHCGTLRYCRCKCAEQSRKKNDVHVFSKQFVGWGSCRVSPPRITHLDPEAFFFSQLFFLGMKNDGYRPTPTALNTPPPPPTPASLHPLFYPIR